MSGADFAADVAVLFARGKAKLHLRSPKPRQTRLPKTGLEGVGKAGLHAFPAANTGS